MARLLHGPRVAGRSSWLREIHFNGFLYISTNPVTPEQQLAPLLAQDLIFRFLLPETSRRRKFGMRFREVATGHEPVVTLVPRGGCRL